LKNKIKYATLFAYLPVGLLNLKGLLAIYVLFIYLFNKDSIIKLFFSCIVAIYFYLVASIFDAKTTPITLFVIIVMPLLTFTRFYANLSYKKELVYYSVIGILIFLIPFDNARNMWFSINFDRNIFGLIALPIFLYISKYWRFGFFIALVLGYMTGSRNVLLALLIEKLLSKSVIFNLLYKKVPGIFIIITVVTPIIIFYSLSYYAELITFENDRSFSNILDTSNMMRSFAMLHALEFLYENPLVFVFGGGWETYSSQVDLRAHNDFVNLVIKHGMIVVLFFLYYLFKVYVESRIDGSIVVSIIIFTGILGGLGWGIGLYWLTIFIFLFGKKQGSYKIN